MEGERDPCAERGTERGGGVEQGIACRRQPPANANTRMSVSTARVKWTR
jgi:hypothetical protein